MTMGCRVNLIRLRFSFRTLLTDQIYSETGYDPRQYSRMQSASRLCLQIRLLGMHGMAEHSAGRQMVVLLKWPGVSDDDLNAHQA